MVGAVQLVFAAVTVAALAGQAVGSKCASAHWGQPDNGQFKSLAPVQIPPGHVEYEVSIPHPGLGCEPVGVHYGVCEYDASPVIYVTKPPTTILVQRKGDIHFPAQLYSSVKCEPVIPHDH